MFDKSILIAIAILTTVLGLGPAGAHTEGAHRVNGAMFSYNGDFLRIDAVAVKVPSQSLWAGAGDATFFRTVNGINVEVQIAITCVSRIYPIDANHPAAHAMTAEGIGSDGGFYAIDLVDHELGDRAAVTKWSGPPPLPIVCSLPPLGVQPIASGTLTITSLGG